MPFSDYPDFMFWVNVLKQMFEQAFGFELSDTLFWFIIVTSLCVLCCFIYVAIKAGIETIQEHAELILQSEATSDET